MIDWRIYLPASWAEDPQRCAEAGVPKQVQFATKPRSANGVDPVDLAVEFARVVPASGNRE